MTEARETAMRDDAFDATVRAAIVASITRDGVVPTIARVAQSLATDVDTVRASFDRMIAAHVFIARKGSSEIYSYNPFAAEPTDFRVRSGGKEWWALCGWDALGIPNALGAAGTIHSTCADCGDRISVDVDRDGTATANGGAVLHVGVRAVDFWKDIYFT
ncbi:MAG TPA: organomercurial lyase [Candidatus Limnocylindrales bacterium]|nr:organomercurial lyase [Candidatus Limnocylindrales bacterium]